MNAIETLAKDDPARVLIAEILSVVRVSHWSFARFRDNGPNDQLISSRDTENRRDEFEYLREELRLQRERTVKGPRLAAALRTLQQPYVSGLTLVFAGMRREFGLLSLLRTEDLGPFTSAEIQALTLALDSSTDRLSGIPIAEASPSTASADKLDQTAMYVLNRDLAVVLSWDAEEGPTAAITALHARLAQRLPPVIEDAVRDVIKTWTADQQAIGVVHPVPFLTVRVQPLSGVTGLFVGVLLERPPGGEVFNKAARAFNLSPRELETLAHLLKGEALDEVAEAMHIASSTVQDHIKSMLDKTESRNRSELIAKVLGHYNTL